MKWKEIVNEMTWKLSHRGHWNGLLLVEDKESFFQSMLLMFQVAEDKDGGDQGINNLANLKPTIGSSSLPLGIYELLLRLK